MWVWSATSIRSNQSQPLCATSTDRKVHTKATCPQQPPLRFPGKAKLVAAHAPPEHPVRDQIVITIVTTPLAVIKPLLLRTGIPFGFDGQKALCPELGFAQATWKKDLVKVLPK